MIHAILTWSCAYLAIGAIIVHLAFSDDDYYAELLAGYKTNVRVALFGLAMMVIWLPSLIVYLCSEAVRR